MFLSPLFLNAAVLVGHAGCSSDEGAEDIQPPEEDVTFRATLTDLTDLQDGLEAHYDGTHICAGSPQVCYLIDRSGNGRDGVLQGATIVSSPWGQAVNFDGINDLVDLPNALSSPSQFGGVDGEFTGLDLYLSPAEGGVWI